MKNAIHMYKVFRAAGHSRWYSFRYCIKKNQRDVAKFYTVEDQLNIIGLRSKETTMTRKEENTPEDWFYTILAEQGLDDWRIEWSSGGNLCMRSRKIIFLLPKYNDADGLPMFLHEVAHALTPNSRAKSGHDVFWGDKFTELVMRYQ